jgi:transposase
MATTRSNDFFPGARNPKGTHSINERCILRIQDDYCVVIVSGMVLANYKVDDAMAEAFAMVSLVEQGWADQNDVAQAFGCSTRTIRRHQRRFDEGGLAALGQGSGYPQGRGRVHPARAQLVQRLKREGISNREIARRVGVSEVAVRKLLRRLGWKEATVAEPELALDPPQGANPNLSACCAPASPTTAKTAEITACAPAVAITLDHDPADRSGDRLLACLGLLEDARPLFAPGKAVPRAGVLLALPPLVRGGVFCVPSRLPHVRTMATGEFL